jgi:hypothetical protein
MEHVEAIEVLALEHGHPLRPMLCSGPVVTPSVRQAFWCHLGKVMERCLPESLEASGAWVQMTEMHHLKNVETVRHDLRVLRNQITHSASYALLEEVDTLLSVTESLVDRVITRLRQKPAN